jgi:beta-N-acetylhexosaminidase
MQDVGQLFIVGFDGVSLPKAAQNLLGRRRGGGAILFKRNIESLEQVVALNAQIVGAAGGDFPALISVDQEGGRVARLREICTPVPTMRELARRAESSPGLIFKTAAMMGRELASLGFHLDYAPIADVDSNKDNPIIGDRAFSSDALATGDMCAEFIKGLQSSGVAACAKHFPGHGDTQTDSHLELPVLAHTLERLRELELIPFEKAIAADVATMMTAHVLLPAIDEVPATLSRKLLTDVLREQMRYKGLIISDDLEMKGIANHYDLKDTVLMGIEAGVDIFLVCRDTDMAEEAIGYLQTLVERGKVSRERIHQSLTRIHAFKKKYIGAVALPSVEYAQSMIRSAPHLHLMQS